MERIRVQHVITGLGLGGAEGWLLRLLSRLDRERFDCRVVSLLGLDGPAAAQSGALAGELRALGVPVESLGLRRGAAGPGALLRLAALLRQFRPQVLQSWLYHADLLGLAAAKLSGCGARVSWGLRCSYMDFSRYGALTRLTVRACAALSAWPDAVTANSEAGAAQHRALGYRPRRMVVLPNGVDGERFRPDAEARAQLRGELGLAGDEPVIGLVARLDPMKGHVAFCRAAAHVLRQVPRARLLFCGEGTEPGPGGAGELDALLRANGVEGAAIRLGRRTDMPRVYAALDVLALPSLAEGFPNAVAEGLACGLPVAGLDAGDARRMAGPGGIIAEPERSGPGADEGTRAEALAEVLLRALRLPEAERRALGAAGREHVLARYGLDAAVRRWAGHFFQLARR